MDDQILQGSKTRPSAAEEQIGNTQALQPPGDRLKKSFEL